MFHWVIENKLARGLRPRFGKKWARQVPQSVVDRWIKKAKTEYGFRSVICLLDQNSLRFYEQLPVDLLSYYRAKGGLKVAHIPVRLRAHLALSQGQKDRIWRAYQGLPKPTLVFCSAGRMRTHLAVLHIKRKLQK